MKKYPTYWHNNSHRLNMKLTGTTMNLGQLVMNSNTVELNGTMKEHMSYAKYETYWHNNELMMSWK